MGLAALDPPYEGADSCNGPVIRYVANRRYYCHGKSGTERQAVSQPFREHPASKAIALVNAEMVCDNL